LAFGAPDNILTSKGRLHDMQIFVGPRLLLWAIAPRGNMMKTVQIVLLSGLIACTLACGYSSKAASPPQAGPMPAIAQLVPASMNSGGQAFTLTVNGSNFAAKATVNWNQTAQTNTAFVSANQLTVMIPASAIATPGTIQISVTNPGTPGMGVYGGGGTLPETSAAVKFPVN
jgi:hypothetical protein